MSRNRYEKIRRYAIDAMGEHGAIRFVERKEGAWLRFSEVLPILQIAMNPDCFSFNEAEDARRRVYELLEGADNEASKDSSAGR